MSQIAKKEGISALTLGWAPTFIGYSFQGFFKYGLYETFKYHYSNLVGASYAEKYKDLLYVSAAATAEFFADLALCPLEAVKVRIQTANPDARTFPRSMMIGMPQIFSQEGVRGLYKGLAPLWGRQVPYTVMKFWAFERTVNALYAHVVPKPKEECTKTQQLAVTFASGYIAGILCAIVSHPADSIVSQMNKYQKSPGMAGIISELGPVGIWRGLGLRIFIIGTLTGLQWFIYDSFKVYNGLPTTGH